MPAPIRQLWRPRAHLPAPFGPDEPTPRVSFLVAAWNEAGMIERCLRAVAGLSYPDVELVLCAGGSDGTFALAARYAGDKLRVIELILSTPNKLRVRNGFKNGFGSVGSWNVGASLSMLR